MEKIGNQPHLPSSLVALLVLAKMSDLVPDTSEPMRMLVTAPSTTFFSRSVHRRTTMRDVPISALARAMDTVLGSYLGSRMTSVGIGVRRDVACAASACRVNLDAVGAQDVSTLVFVELFEFSRGVEVIVVKIPYERIVDRLQDQTWFRSSSSRGRRGDRNVPRPPRPDEV